VNLTLLVHSGLLSDGVEHLLNKESDLDITSINVDGDSDRLILEKLADYHPHVVILDEEADFYKNGFLYGIFSIHPDLQVLVLNSKNNRIQIFKKQEIQITQSKDLIKAIHGG
jgi:DNA-binding NarL/FixJ family response regulator